MLRHGRRGDHRGKDVKQWKQGDRVCGNPTLGSTEAVNRINGVLTEYRSLPANVNLHGSIFCQKDSSFLPVARGPSEPPFVRGGVNVAVSTATSIFFWTDCYLDPLP